MERETNAIMENQQLTAKEAQPSGSTTDRGSLKVRKGSKNKKKTLKNKKKVPKKLVYFDSSEGPAERDIKWKTSFYARAYCSDLDKIM